MSQTFGQQFLNELEAEAGATRKCLERIPGDAFDWKPHEKSMAMGYLALVVSEIPKWIHTMVTEKDLDFATYPHFQAKDGAELAKHFDENMELARSVLQSVSDEVMEEGFALKNNGQMVMTAPRKANIGPSINHLVHHRGQLTVYMRLCDLPVPSIYGPSADDKAF